MTSPLVIFVRTMTGDILTLDVDTADIVGNIKVLVQDKTGTPSDHQTMLIDRWGTLEDHRTLADLDVQHESYLQFLVRIPGSIHVFVKDMTGQTITLEVEDDDTISRFKRKIQERMDIPVQQQRLIHQGKGLENDIIISDRNTAINWLQHNNCIHLLRLIALVPCGDHRQQPNCRGLQCALEHALEWLSSPNEHGSWKSAHHSSAIFWRAFVQHVKIVSRWGVCCRQLYNKVLTPVLSSYIAWMSVQYNHFPPALALPAFVEVEQMVSYHATSWRVHIAGEKA